VTAVSCLRCRRPLVVQDTEHAQSNTALPKHKSYREEFSGLRRDANDDEQ
jgi:hypothetical protein